MQETKHFKLILILLFSGLLLSCNESNEPVNDAIIGTWENLVKYDDYYGKTEVGISYKFAKNKKVTCCIWEYEHGKKIIEDTYTFTYRYSGSTVTMIDSSGSTITYSISINGKTMTLNGKTYTKK